MLNKNHKIKGAALTLAVTALSACGGGSTSSSSNMSSDGDTSSVASSVQSTSNSSEIALSSTSEIALSSSSIAVSSSAQTQSSISFSSSPRVAGQPHASFAGTYPDDVSLAPANVLFRSDQSWDEDGMIVSAQWGFGDGTTSNDFNPRHTYSDLGTYQITLTVTDNDGLTDTAVLPITVIAQPGEGTAPTASIFSSTERGDIPLSVTFDGSNSGAAAGAEIVSYKWEFPDRTTAYGPVVNNTFAEAFNHEVYLTVTDNKGLTDTSAITVQGVMGVPKGEIGMPMQTDGNPFADSAFYVSPDIEVLQNQSLEKIDPVTEEKLYNDIKFIQHLPSAVWLDRTEAIYGGEENGGRRPLAGHLDEAVKQQQALKDDNGNVPPMTAVIIVYNLPDRDCAALASNGLLNEVSDGDGDGMPDGTGLQRYREEYINVISATFKKYPSLRIVAMLEPDGYPNMVTNAGGTPTTTDKCLAVKEAEVYKKSLQYAIAEFHKLDNVYTYIDIGHSGWLGWDNKNDDNLQKGVIAFTDLVKGATPGGDLGAIKGFASNTSGYTPLREPYISSSYAHRQSLAGFYEWNHHVDELSFIDTLYKRFTSGDMAEADGGTFRFVPGQGFPDNLGFIIDTARNGWGGPNRPTGEGAPAAKDDSSYRIDRRRHRGHWCNIADTGIGEIPHANPDPSRPYIDAYYWMKPPGESDGISDPTAIEANEEGKSYDPMCGGEASNLTGVAADVLMDSPHAGAWFHDQFIMLIENQHPPLGTKEPTGSAGGKASLIESFDDYATGSAPGGNWSLATSGDASASVSADKFAGIRGKSVYLTALNEPKEDDEIAMLELEGDDVGPAASNFFGRARIFVEEHAGEQSEVSWTLINAQGDVDQVGQVKYRIGSVGDQLAIWTDSNGRGSTCEKVSATPVPKEAWACLEWKLNPTDGLSVWLDGEQINDLTVSDTMTTEGCSNQSWGAGPGAFELVGLGIGRYKPNGQQPQRPQGEPEPPAKPPVSLFIDDVATAEGRLGCGTVRP